MYELRRDKEMENRIKHCSMIANKVVRLIQKEVKLLSVMGESDPFLVQDMSVAYASAILKYMLYKALKENNQEVDWNGFKEATHKAIDIAFLHCEDQFIKTPEEKALEQGIKQ